MTCAEFQKVLPYIIETGGNGEEEAHLRDCHVCSDLVADLRYIAEQAKLLVPMEDPSPAVWDGIKGSLEREGMIRPARARGRLLGPKSGPLPWIVGIAVLLFALGAFLYQRTRVQPAAPSSEVAIVTAPVQTASLPGEQDDQQVLTQVSTARPAMASTYETNLKQVNAAIAEARQALQQNPADDDARLMLMKAYQQKAMLYELAVRFVQ
ncbi:MAG: hypothetical protein ACR2IF_12880 [Terriglobales bacterium]